MYILDKNFKWLSFDFIFKQAFQLPLPPQSHLLRIQDFPALTSIPYILIPKTWRRTGIRAKQLPWTVLTVLKKYAVLEVISGPKMSQIWHKGNTVHVKMVIFNKWCMHPGLFQNQRAQHRRVDKYDTFKWAVEQISKFLQRRFREVGFRIPEARFQIPKAGFRIPKAWILVCKGKNMLDSGFRIPLHGTIQEFSLAELYN